MSLESAIPILAFLDRDQTVAFYEKIGFKCNASWDGYIMCSRDKIEIHLWKTDDAEIPKNTGCYVRVSEVDSLHNELQKHNIIHPNGQLENKPWQVRQFSIIDNSGNIIHFGQLL